MHRAIVVLFTCAVLLVAGPLSIVAAQDDAPANPQLGDEVSFVGDDGNEAAVVVVEDLVDPFEDSADDPPRRSHFVLLSLSIENTGEEMLEVDPAAVFLQDEDGVLYAAEEDLDLGDEDPLEAADLDAGDDVSGAIGYAVPDRAADLARVFYRPADDRLLLLADLRRGGGGQEEAAADVEGTWEGETEEGGSLSFVVADGGIARLSVSFVCPSGKGTTLLIGNPRPIEDGAFTVRYEGDDVMATLAGTFTSDEEAEGTLEVDVQSEECDLALGWTATRLLADLRQGEGDETPAAGGFDGTWPGETEEGGLFNFVVAGGSITSFVVNYVCPSGKAWISGFTVAPPVPIEDGAFTATGRIEGGDRVATLTGTFTSDEEAEGTVEVDRPDEEECDLALAWTATRE